MTTPTFSSKWDSVMEFGNTHQSANLEVANFSRCKNIKGNPIISGAFLDQGHVHFFLWVQFYDGPWKTQTMYHI